MLPTIPRSRLRSTKNSERDPSSTTATRVSGPSAFTTRMFCMKALQLVAPAPERRDMNVLARARSGAGSTALGSTRPLGKQPIAACDRRLAHHLLRSRAPVAVIDKARLSASSIVGLSVWNAWVAARAFCFCGVWVGAFLLLAGFCKPGEKCWPTADEWKQLGAQLTGKLVQPQAPAPGPHTPFELEDQPGASQSSGWLDAWSAAPSPYAVVVANAKDIATAVDFARAHHLRIVVKGTGHDYLGRSTAADGLLVW